MPFETVVAQVGAEAASSLRALTLAVYGRAEAIARERGVILADTKLEFGVDPTTGAVTLGDEVLTPDSSRFWPRGPVAARPRAGQLRQAVRA